VLHIFDVDSTVIKNSSAWYFLREAVKTGVIRVSQIYKLPFELLRYKLGRPNMDFIEEAVRHMSGIDRAVLEQTAENCFRRYMQPNIYTGAAYLIREALKQGERVIFATSSFHTLIRPLEQYFGIEGSIASMLEFKDNITTGRITGNSCFGNKKKAAAENWLAQNSIDPESVYFYSDSYTDLPFLEICGKPTAVNPDRFLLREAKKRGWDIVYFKKTLNYNSISGET
jgi:HAD superfamily hydrolase (TIGR01490 family)